MHKFPPRDHILGNIQISPKETPPQTGLPLASPPKKMVKQVTGKRDDTPLHTAARVGNINLIMDILGDCYGEEELVSLLSKQNYAGETPLYVAAEYGYIDLVRLIIDQCDIATASIKANNGFDALHIAAKQGDLGMPIVPFFEYIYLYIYQHFQQTVATKLCHVFRFYRYTESFNGGSPGVINDGGYIKYHRIAHSGNARLH